MKVERLSSINIENMIRKYIDDAAKLAAGARWDSLNCYLDGLKSPAELSDAIRDLGAAYIERMKALRNAAPTVRGDTISIFEPKPAPEANAPSLEDVAFMSACRKQLLEHGFVLAADADTYEAIAKKYPDYVHPARVRGSEARRWVALHDPQIVARAAAKVLRKPRR